MPNGLAETVGALEDAEIVQTVEGEEITLASGDSLHFRGSNSHRWENRSDRQAKVLWTGTMSILRPRNTAQNAAPPAALPGTSQKTDSSD